MRRSLNHNFGPGLGLALVAWMVEVKEGIAAIKEPFASCASLLDIVVTAIQLPSATFAGVAFWFTALVSSTTALIVYIVRRLKSSR